MKTKLILTFLVTVVISLNLLAQDKKPKGNRESIIDYKTELGLSDAQIEQIKAIQKEYLPKMKQARQSEDREILKKLNKERRAKIELLLTPEQLQKWKVIREKMKADRLNQDK